VNLLLTHLWSQDCRSCCDSWLLLAAQRRRHSVQQRDARHVRDFAQSRPAGNAPAAAGTHLRSVHYRSCDPLMAPCKSRMHHLCHRNNVPNAPDVSEDILQPAVYRCNGLTALSRRLEEHAALLRAPRGGQPVRLPDQPRWMHPPSPEMFQMHIKRQNTGVVQLPAMQWQCDKHHSSMAKPWRARLKQHVSTRDVPHLQDA
jgi:hypothetical protein